jgi:hypothetical protein
LPCVEKVMTFCVDTGVSEGWKSHTPTPAVRPGMMKLMPRTVAALAPMPTASRVAAAVRKATATTVSTVAIRSRLLMLLGSYPGRRDRYRMTRPERSDSRL